MKNDDLLPGALVRVARAGDPPPCFGVLGKVVAVKNDRQTTRSRVKVSSAVWNNDRWFWSDELRKENEP